MCTKTPISKEYVPKDDIQQREFLKKYPKYDGRGLLIAIIDSGIDVSLPGLQKTSTGLPKVVDCFDFNKSGVVDTSKIQRSGNDNILIGLNGRPLKIPSKWKNPSGQWHLGIISLKKLCPNEIFKSLNENLREKFIEKVFKPNNVEIIEDKNVAELLPENLTFDCIVWFDGRKWLACIIPFYCDNLESIKILTNYQDSHEFSYILKNISYCITIKNDGNLLEIIFPLEGHGTAMAHVAAAHFPEEPERDGIAPGAQIVSMAVGGRNMKDEQLKNALLKCIEMKVDIVNMSFWSRSLNYWEIAELLEKMVKEHEIIIMHSAGNDGPIFSTIDTVNNEGHIFFIGGINTPEIRKKFSDRKVIDDTVTLAISSSRGPLPTGARGITVTAPAVANISFPKWHLKEHVLGGGTSNSSAIASGAVACLLSALKETSIQYSPATIKLAITNTAKLPQNGGDKLGFGDGIIQLQSAFHFLQSYSKIIPMQSLPHPTLICKGWTKEVIEGISIIQRPTSPLCYYFAIKVENFYKKTISWILKYSIKSKQNFEIQHSKTVVDNIFYIKIDVTDLKPQGAINYAEIYGFHPSHSYIGPIFHLPITIIVPVKAKQRNLRSATAKPYQPYNFFFDLPPKSKNCNIIFTSILEEVNQPITINKTLNKFDGEFYNGKVIEEDEGQWLIKIRWKDIIVISIVSRSRNEISYKFKLDINF